MAKTLRVLTIACLALGLAGTRVMPVQAAGTYTITDCSSDAQLQADVGAANSSGGGTINFACSGTIVLGSSDASHTTLSVTSDITVNGNGYQVAISGNNADQLFYIYSGYSLALNGLTLENGSAQCNTIANRVCTSTYPAIFNNGTLTITQSTLTGNSPSCHIPSRECDVLGGAIYNSGTLAITDSTLSGNSPTCVASGPNVDCRLQGGAIDNTGAATLTDSTLSGNSSHCTGSGAGSTCYMDGGAIDNGGTVALTNSTLSENYTSCVLSGNNTHCYADGGAIDNASGAQLTSTHDTLSGNFATCRASGTPTFCTILGGAIYNGGTLNVGATIIANDTPPTNCFNAGTVTDWGYNLTDDNGVDCGLTNPTDQTNTNPDLGPLANNGGPTQTMALLPGSPAIDQIPTTAPNDLCPAGGADQRGYPRPDTNESICDVGAYEYQDNTVLPTGTTAYDIESSNFYCNGGGISCVGTSPSASTCLTSGGCSGLSDGDAEAFGPPNGSTYGIPDELILACRQATPTGYLSGYLDVVSSSGNADYPKGTRTGPGVYGLADPGAITGKATLIGGDGPEMNPSQTSSISASAYDLTTGVRGSVSGIQNTDNGSDTLNSGGFRVTITGTLQRVTVTGNSPGVATYEGTISCLVGGSHGNDLKDAGKDTTAVAEGELENVLGDNSNPFSQALTWSPTTSPGAFNFGARPSGPEVSQTFTLTSTGPFPSGLVTVSLTGDSSFLVQSGQCSAVHLTVAAPSCTVTILDDCADGQAAQLTASDGTASATVQLLSDGVPPDTIHTDIPCF